jgi:hypothetical protein
MKDLEAYADEVQKRMRKPNKDEQMALLVKDAYEGRPFDLQQRLRAGSVPVLESSPDISLDEVGGTLPWNCKHLPGFSLQDLLHLWNNVYMLLLPQPNAMCMRLSC